MSTTNHASKFSHNFNASALWQNTFCDIGPRTRFPTSIFLAKKQFSVKTWSTSISWTSRTSSSSSSTTSSPWISLRQSKIHCFVNKHIFISIGSIFLFTHDSLEGHIFSLDQSKSFNPFREFEPRWWQTLFWTQAQHLCFIHDSIWFVWFDTIICLSNLSCELWNRKLEIKEIYFKKSIFHILLYFFLSLLSDFLLQICSFA